MAEEMKEMRDGFEVLCAVHLSEVQRRCLMVVPIVANMRWCQEEGPQWCASAYAHIMSLVEETGLSAADLELVRTDLSFATRGCFAEAAMTKEGFECIMRAKTAEDIDTCAYLAP